MLFGIVQVAKKGQQSQGIITKMAKAIRNKLEGVVEELTTVLALPDIAIPNRLTDEEPSNVAQFENAVRLLTVREHEILGFYLQIAK